MKIKNMIFDVDGTLWDVTPLAVKAWNQVIEDMAADREEITIDDLKALFGKPMDYITEHLFPNLSADDVQRYLQHCCDVEDEMLKRDNGDFLYPAVRETIKILSKHFGIFIVSNCQSGYIETFLDKSELGEYVTDFESFGGTGLQKDENIRLIIERNGLEDAVYIGDIQSDCDSTRKAGIPFIHAAYGYGAVDAPDMVIDSFDELLKLI